MTSLACARCRATWPSIGVALFVVAGVAALVAGVDTAPRHGESVAAAALPASASAEQIGAMVARLAKRLRHDPDDVAAWALLARSQVTLGHHAEAVTAYRRASGLRPDDAGLPADSVFARQVQPSIAEARRLGGIKTPS